MGLFDALRGRDREVPADQAGTDGGGEQVDFRPRSDGSYRSTAGALQFAGRTVRETDTAGLTRSGEFTPAGRFLLAAPLEPSVVVTVVNIGDDSFTARRTAVADRRVETLDYRFAPSGS